MNALKTRLENDMTQAMKSRDELTRDTLRMTLTAIRHAEVAGKEPRELSDADIEKVIAKQAKQRRESADAFTEAGRTESARRELAEEEVLARYLPQPLSDDELRALIDDVLATGGFTEAKQMGQAMKAVQAKVAGRADGKVVAGIVKERLT